MFFYLLWMLFKRYFKLTFSSSGHKVVLVRRVKLDQNGDVFTHTKRNLL